ncbi:MAG: substrate-binding domain-containing protein [Lachnospiraceae bacterium]|nr:substrate-binding domain-containing protein [Lachnospiraceae bacterium]
MKKKFLGVVLSVAMVASLLAGCGSKDDDSNQPADDNQATEAPAADDNQTDEANTDDDASKGSDELIYVGVINNNPTESGYRTANDADLKEKFCEANGYKAEFVYGDKNEEQLERAQKLIQNGIDYLLLSAAGTAGWETVLQDAKAAGIKVILFDRTIDAPEDLYEASIVSDMDKEGETAVNWLADQGLDSYKIIHIQGQMGSAAQKGRSKALEAKVEAEDNWEIVTQQTGNWEAADAQEIVQSVIDSKQEFNVIYAENDNMADGAVQALDKAGITHGVDGDVIIMGFDCNKFALKALKEGSWNYDGQCNPFQAQYIEDVINKLEKGEELDEKVIILNEQGFDAKTITDADIETYGIGD